MPMEIGPCRASFTRWYYDAKMNKCLRFYYGGCRGNGNRFETEDDCMSMCLQGGEANYNDIYSLNGTHVYLILFIISEKCSRAFVNNASASNHDASSQAEK